MEWQVKATWTDHFASGFGIVKKRFCSDYFLSLFFVKFCWWYWRLSL